jgi:hypothetical protein
MTPPVIVPSQCHALSWDGRSAWCKNLRRRSKPGGEKRTMLGERNTNDIGSKPDADDRLTGLGGYLRRGILYDIFCSAPE